MTTFWKSLKTITLVFIIGEPHMGKTYTALYILWEYHQKGYETIHIRHDKLIHLLHQHDDDLKRTSSRSLQSKE